MDKLFELAARKKFRFPFRGQITVEDLFDLNTTSLNEIYKTLKAKEKESNGESLFDTKNSEDEILEAQIEIVKYIFALKVEEKEQFAKAVEAKREKQKIAAIIETKKDQALMDSSIEELEKKLASL